MQTFTFSRPQGRPSPQQPWRNLPPSLPFSALRAGHLFIKVTNTKRHELDRHEAIQNKKAVSYRKDDSAMWLMNGRPKNFQESLTTPTATFPEFLMGFCSDWARCLHFYRAMLFSAKRGIEIACRLSVCPSVRLSVCDVGGSGRKSWKLIARTLSQTLSLFVAQRPSTYSQGNIGKFWGD